MSDPCIFCAIVAGDAPSTRVYEDERTIAFLDAFPGTDGHTLVIPKAHTQDLTTIGQDDLAASIFTAQRIVKAMPEAVGADGVNVLNCCGADAWQTVFHFHLHVIPRYAGRDGVHEPDGLKVPWTPGVPGDRELAAELGHKLSTALTAG